VPYPPFGSLVSYKRPVSADGGRIVAIKSKDLTADTGHIHLSIDGRMLSILIGS